MDICHTIITLSILLHIKTHGCVSVAKKAMWHTSVLFTETINSLSSTSHISITTGPIFIKIIYFYCMPSLYVTLHTKFEINQPSSSRDIYVFLKIVPFSSPISSTHRFTKVILSHQRYPSRTSIYFNFGTPIRLLVAYLSLEFGDV